jgi:hypothetical protein
VHVIICLGHALQGLLLLLMTALRTLLVVLTLLLPLCLLQALQDGKDLPWQQHSMGRQQQCSWLACDRG